MGEHVDSGTPSARRGNGGSRGSRARTDAGTHSSTSTSKSPRNATDGRATTDAHLNEDRRHQSKRATTRRHAAESALLDALLLPHAGSVQYVGSAGQTLLIRALARLERQEDVGAAVAWAAAPDGTPNVLAADPPESARRIQPTNELYDALLKLERVQRLTDPKLGMELTALAVRGVSVVAPVAGLSTTPAAVILLYPKKTGRSLRPRTVAVLTEVAAGLSRSMSTNLALDRLGLLDEAVAQIDRQASLGRLVSEIVHEIRNPLVSVKTFLQLLPERLQDPEFHHDFRLVVNDEVQRLERMLDDLLRHASPRTASSQSGECARIDEVLRTTLQLMSYRFREQNIAFESNLRSNLPVLGLSEDSLRQLLLNLLLNASAITPAGGSISLSVDWSPTWANHVEIKIADDGPGIDPSLVGRIFEPFWTTRSEGGGGLGLAICKRIVEDAGGEIEVHNRREGGACFRVDLPIAN
jgi:signal transduction histidine kinase